MALGKMFEQLVPQHAVAAQDQDAHGSLAPAPREEMGNGKSKMGEGP
jgi:hypothetical protein